MNTSDSVAYGARVGTNAFGAYYKHTVLEIEFRPSTSSNSVDIEMGRTNFDALDFKTILGLKRLIFYS